MLFPGVRRTIWKMQVPVAELLSCRSRSIITISYIPNVRVYVHEYLFIHTYVFGRWIPFRSGRLDGVTTGPKGFGALNLKSAAEYSWQTVRYCGAPYRFRVTL